MLVSDMARVCRKVPNEYGEHDSDGSGMGIMGYSFLANTDGWGSGDRYSYYGGNGKSSTTDLVFDRLLVEALRAQALAETQRSNCGTGMDTATDMGRPDTDTGALVATEWRAPTDKVQAGTRT